MIKITCDPAKHYKEGTGEYGLFADYGRDLVFVFHGFNENQLGQVLTFSGIHVLEMWPK